MSFDDRALAALPATTADIATRLGIPLASARTVMMSLRKRGLSYVSAWITNGRGGNPAAVWSKGDCVDAQKPVRNRSPSNAGDWATSDTATAILCHLESVNLTVKQAADVAGVSVESARRAIKQMHAAKVIRIAKWISSRGIGGHPTMVFALGQGRDAIRKKPLTKKEINQRWRATLVEKYGPEIASKRIQSRRNKGAESIVSGGRVIYERRVSA